MEMLVVISDEGGMKDPVLQWEVELSGLAKLFPVGHVEERL